MDRFNYVVNESNDADAIDLGFANRYVLSSNDVEKVLFESQAIQPNHGCDKNSLFLNPINEFLSEINEYGNGVCVDPALISPNMHKETGTVDSNWNVHEPIYVPNSTCDEFSTMIGMPNFGPNSVQPPIQSLVFGASTPYAPTEHSVLTSDHQTFVSSDYNLLGSEYTTTPNKLFLNIPQQQQMTFKNVTPLTNISQQETATLSAFNNRNYNDGTAFNQNYSENLINTIVSLPSCTTIKPISNAENNVTNRPLDLVNNQVVFDISRPSVISNETNNRAYLFPMSVKNSIHQNEQDSYGNIILPRTQEQPLTKENLGNNSNNRKMPAQNSQGITLSHVQSISNLNRSKHENSLSIVEPLYQSKALNDPQLHLNGPHQLAFKGLEQANTLNWTAVLPRTQFIQPPEIIIMQPLRTRKIISTNHTTSRNIDLMGSEATIKPLTGNIIPPLSDMALDKNYENGYKACHVEDTHHGICSLSEYFDTTSINIPMIKERSRVDSKNENRRKQKLHIIPGAENLTFEVQRSTDHQETNGNVIQIQTTISEINKAIKSLNADNPYPETELPELDEIFRRKKKTNNTTAAGSKRTYQISQSISVGNGCEIKQKKPCFDGILQQSETDTMTINESSNSFEEKISVAIAICKEKSNLLGDKNDLVYSSDAESLDTIDEGSQPQAGRSFKCKQCKKLLKTTRSLAIHTKRCVNLNQAKVGVQALNKSSHNKDKSDDVKGKIHAQKTESVKLIPLPNSLNTCGIQELNATHYFRSESIIAERNPKALLLNVQPNQKTNPRPITRSQTRRSTGSLIPYSAFAKLSK